MSRATYRLERNPATGELEWAAESHGGPGAWIAWLLLAVASVLFLAVLVYFVLWGLAILPAFDPSKLPDGGSFMRQPLNTLMGGKP